MTMTLSPTALEAAARALALQARVSEMEARGFNGNHASEYADEWWRSHLDRARHCLTAYLTQLSAEGYGVVPREATPIWPLLHQLLLEKSARIAEAEAQTTYEARVAIINGVSAHIATKLEELLAAQEPQS